MRPPATAGVPSHAKASRMRLLAPLRGLVVLLLAGCNGVVLACTDMGCLDALEVRFSRAPVGAFRVEAIPAGGGEPAVFECASAQLCPIASFPDLVAERVTIRLTTAEGTVSQEFTPRYEKVYPNGRRCGGACQQGTVTFQL